jgi:hypothetical protein
MAYIPSDRPLDSEQLGAYLSNELQRISREFQSSQPFAIIDTLYAAPLKPREGMIVKADGTTWNPGSGAGFYGYRSSAWRFLG